MVSASLSALGLPFSPEYLRLALTLGLMIGLIKLALGLARLGALVNFVFPPPSSSASRPAPDF